MPELTNASEAKSIRVGVIQAIASFLFWGFITGIYYKSLDGVSAWELLAWRVLGGLPIALILVCFPPGIGRIWEALSDRKSVATLCCSTVLIGANWFTFIYSIISDRLVEASLGYFINPLVSVLLARVILGERLRPMQLLAIGIACAGVSTFCAAIVVNSEGGASLNSIPWIPFVLPISFGLYGLLRKQMKADSITGITIEMAILFPFMFAIQALLMLNGEARFLNDSIRVDGLLILGGLVTIIPLILFAAGARRMKLSTIGVLQYIAPSCQFMLAIFYFGEVVSGWKIIAFMFIWFAVIVYSIDSIRASRQAH